MAVGSWIGEVLLGVAGVDVILLACDPVDLEVSLIAVGVGVGNVDLIAGREVIDWAGIIGRIENLGSR